MEGVLRSIQNMFGGMRVIVKDAYPVYGYRYMYKKHRKKKARTVIRYVEEYREFIEDGSVIQDQINKCMYLNRKSYNALVRDREYAARDKSMGEIYDRVYL